MGASRFGRFQLLQRLGAGSVGEVLLVSDGRHHFALKRLLPHLRDGAAAATFANEAALARSLRHPNIVAVLEHGRIDGVPYLLMEYVDGKNLHRLLAAGAPLPPPVAAFVAREVCLALAYVHAVRDAEGRPLGLIHRDVSPSNVLIARDGQVKLCDFGIAKASRLAADGTATGVGVIKGKRGYLSPEQAAGEPLDARTDVFSAGAVLFEALTGSGPFDADEDGTVVARAGAALLERPSRRRPGLPVAIDRVCARALAHSRDERFAGAAELAEALQPMVATADAQAELAACMRQRFQAAASLPNEPTRTVASSPRSRWTVVALLLASVVAAVWLLGARRARPTGLPDATPSPVAQTGAPATSAATAPMAATAPASAASAMAPASAPPSSRPRPTAVPAPSRAGAASRVRPSRHTSATRSGRAGDADFMPDPFRR